MTGNLICILPHHEYIKSTAMAGFVSALTTRSIGGEITIAASRLSYKDIGRFPRYDGVILPQL
jgi:hypothetical protein